MRNSGFQMKEQRLVSMNYDINPGYAPAGKEIQLKFNGRTNVTPIGPNEAHVLLDLSIFQDEPLEKVPFRLSCVHEGLFTWNDEFPKEIINKMLRTNAPALLLSYDRTIISLLTAYSGLPTLVLPLINFNADDTAAVPQKAPETKA